MIEKSLNIDYYARSKCLQQLTIRVFGFKFSSIVEIGLRQELLYANDLVLMAENKVE